MGSFWKNGPKPGVGLGSSVSIAVRVDEAAEQVSDARPAVDALYERAWLRSGVQRLFSIDNPNETGFADAVRLPSPVGISEEPRHGSWHG